MDNFIENKLNILYMSLNSSIQAAIKQELMASWARCATLETENIKLKNEIKELNKIISKSSPELVSFLNTLPKSSMELSKDDFNEMAKAIVKDLDK